MRPRLLLWMAVLAASCVGFAPAPFPKSRPDRGSTELARLQGTWDVVERYRHGHPALSEGTQVKIAGTRLDFLIAGEIRSSWEMGLDPAASPRTLDWNSAGSKYVAAGNVLKGIYRFEGEQLHLYCTENGRARPTAFDTKGSNGYLMIMRRAGR